MCLKGLMFLHNNISGGLPRYIIASSHTTRSSKRNESLPSTLLKLVSDHKAVRRQLMANP